MAKFFRKFKKPYFGAVLDHFWPNLVKNEFSWKKDLRQFLNTPIIYQREKNHKKPMTHFWGLIIYFCFILCWLSKNHTHAKKVGQTSELLFGIYWKTTIYLKNCCWKSWILIFTMLYLKKKKKKRKAPGNLITLPLRTKNFDDWSSWDIESDRLKLVIMWVIFCPFTTRPLLKTQKIRILKKRKKLLERSSFYACVPKTTIIWGTFPEILRETEFFVIFGIRKKLSTMSIGIPWELITFSIP